MFYKRKPRVLLLCGLKLRDLNNLIILSLILKKFGVKTKILPSVINIGLIKNYPADLVVFSHLFGADSASLVDYLRKRDVLISSLNVEQISKDEQTFVRDAKFDKKAFHLPDLLFVWSEYIKGLLVKNKIVGEEKIKVVGCPKLDFCNTKIASMLHDKQIICKKYGLDHKKKIIVWATGYTLLDYTNEQVTNFLKMYPTRFPDMKPEEVVNNICNTRIKTGNAFLRLANKYQDVQFIIKVHPTEAKNNFYLKMCGETNFSNVKVLRNVDLLESIFISDAWMHFNSTTSIEAGALSKPTICSSIGIDKEFLLEELSELSVVVRTEKELEHCLVKILNGENIMSKKNFNSRKRFINKWLGAADGKNSRRHAEEILKLLKEQKRKQIFLKYTRTYFFYKILEFIKFLIGLKPHDSLKEFLLTFKKYHDERNRFFTQKEVIDLEKKYSKLIDENYLL